MIKNWRGVNNADTPRAVKVQSPRVVFITGLRVLPPVSGGQLRSSFVIQCFQDKGYAVHTIALADRKPFGEKRGGEDVVGSKLFTLSSRIGYKLNIPPFWCALKLLFFPGTKIIKALKTADIVVADFPFTATAFVWAKQAKKILNTHNVEHHLYKNPLWSFLVYQLEVWARKRSEYIFCCTDSDCQFFSALSAAVFYLPNGIDIKKYKTSPELRIKARQSLGIEENEKIFIFPASAYEPNNKGLLFLESFAQQYCDQLRALGVKIFVVGSVSAAKEIGVLQCFGRVDDIMPYFFAADGALNPVFSGSGSSVKVAEFIAAKLPVITAIEGVRGFSSIEGGFRIFADSEKLYQEIERVVRDPESSKEMAQHAFDSNLEMITGQKSFEKVHQELKNQ